MDDSTYMYSSSDPACLSAKLSEQYKKLANYMGNNKLVINDDKTHLLVMATARNAAKRELVSIKTGTVEVKPIETEKLLGLHIHQSLKWKEHVIDSDKSMIKILTTRLSALKKVSRNAAFKTRLMVANSCFLSIISYMIVVWGGTEEYVIKAVQIIQNKAARCITKLSWYTPVRTLLLQCNWLSIKQLIFYHTVLQVWKVNSGGLPAYIHSKMKLSVTRSAVEGTLLVPVAESSMASKSFMVRSAVMWNSIPASLRKEKSFQTFKGKLRTWTKENIELD